MLFGWLKTLLSSIFKVFGAQTISPTHPASSAQMNTQNALVAQDTGLSIPFYPGLIDHLELDHQHLLALYTHISDLFNSKKYADIASQLAIFKADFKAHLDAENIKFYGYLEQSLKDQSEQFAELRRFRKEMRSIERTVIKFLDHWMEFGVDRQSAPEFKTEYNAIGAALIKRIESEELELYTLYQA